MATKKKVSQPIFTKTGDRGQTSLANGERVGKDSLIFKVIGSLDELNSWIGLLVTQLSKQPAAKSSKSLLLKVEKQLLHVQEQLFYIGAEVAQSPKVKFNRRAITQLERHGKQLHQKLDKTGTRSFYCLEVLSWELGLISPGLFAVAASETWLNSLEKDWLERFYSSTLTVFPTTSITSDVMLTVLVNTMKRSLLLNLLKVF